MIRDIRTVSVKGIRTELNDYKNSSRYKQGSIDSYNEDIRMLNDSITLLFFLKREDVLQDITLVQDLTECKISVINKRLNLLTITSFNSFLG